MKIDLIELSEGIAALLISDAVEISNADNALDLIGSCGYQGAAAMIIYKQNLHASFFDLSTGLAGEVLQKFSNYNMKLAIVGDFSEHTSKSLNDFIAESNRAGKISFVASLQEAKEKLSH